MCMINMINQGEINPRTPTTELRLYSGVPWDDTYMHVRLYASQSELIEHLENWRVYPSDYTQLSNMTPIRVGEAVVRVPFTEMQALDLNYLSFCNHGISEKWVFCFIDSINWLSENTTQINFSLDVFQNNFYNINIKPCFIEYQHIPKSEDVIGSNLIPVDLETGEYIVAEEQRIDFKNWGVAIYCAHDDDTQRPSTIDIGYENNMYCGVDRYFYLILKDDGTLWEEQISSYIQNVITFYEDKGKVDSIINMVLLPDAFVDLDKNPRGLIGILPEDEKYIQCDINNNLFGGYTPKNNKLYSFPWCFVQAYNGEGFDGVYRFEYSDSEEHVLTFRSQFSLSTLPCVVTMPVGYKGTHNCVSESFENKDFPMVAWSTDTYKTWLAQNKATLSVQQLGAGVNTVIGAAKSIGSVAAAPFTSGASLTALPGGLSQTGSGIYDILSINAQKTDKQALPNQAKGKNTDDGGFISWEHSGIRFLTMSCRKEFAEIADDFFTTYGYPINKIDTPLFNSRPYWNHIKTKNCGFTGAIDLDQLKQIRNIFNNGVTLWHTDDVGNYNLNNNQ